MVDVQGDVLPGIDFPSTACIKRKLSLNLSQQN